MKRRDQGPDPARPKSMDRRTLDALEAASGRERRKAPFLKEGPAFAELVAATNFSFLRGASHAEDMVRRGLELGLTGLGIADRNTVAGVVRAWSILKRIAAEARDALLKDKQAREGADALLTEAEKAACVPDMRLVTGARLVFADGTPDIVAYPATRHGWGRLTRLLTRGNLRAVKGGCILRFDDLLSYLDDLLLIVLPHASGNDDAVHADPVDFDFEDAALSDVVGHLSLVPPLTPETLEETLQRLWAQAPGRLWLGISQGYAGKDRRIVAELAGVAARVGVPLLATNDALYAAPSDRPLQDVLSCIRHGTTIAAAGRRLRANAERHLKSPAEMARLYGQWPEAVAQSVSLLSAIRFDLEQLRYEYPHEPVPEGWEPQAWLAHLTWQAAHAHYGEELPEKLRLRVAEELAFIAERNYACYFLTVHDVVRFARDQVPPILCQGRGSAANSAVCFLLGVTSVDPMQHDLLFSRFISSDRDEPPDIDVDFEHERREEVMQYIYRRYGRHRAGIAATVIHYRSRSAVREVAKVLGLSEDIAARIGSTVWGSYSGDLGDRRLIEAGFDLGNPHIARLRALVDRLLRHPFPRHLSQHVGGFVLTQDRLDETVPVHHAAMEDRSFIEWDKDDLDALGLMKVDVLALGMLTCIRKAYDLMRLHGLGDHELTVDIESGDAEVYDMLCRGDSIGVFQVESRAQINMLPRLRPRTLYDLTVQVAIVRPGPIEGDMVHPYLRRRCGEEKPELPSPAPPHDPHELKTLLGHTFGVPLFQEQAMRLAIVAAEFTDAEANQLRRSMATFRQIGGMDKFRDKMIGGMVRRGYEPDFAERCYRQIEGFGSYGFPESHALSFARLVYVSALIKCHQPAVFACALLNSQPMGFYAPAQIVRDAREHGVTVGDVDVNSSDWDNMLEPLLRSRNSGRGEGKGRALALRLGLRQVDGFREDWAKRLADARGQGLFTSMEDLARRAGLPARALRLLADADACRSLGQDRRAALWEVRRTPSDELPLFAAARQRDRAACEMGEEPDAMLPAMPLAEHVATDYQMTRLSLKGHPMQFLRPMFAAEGALSCAEAAAAKNGARVRTAGVVLVRQRPGKGNAVFITIEDETGIVNILLWARLFEMQRRPVMASRLMLVEGEVQRSREGVVHLMASRVHDRTVELSSLSSLHPDESMALCHPRASGHPRNVRILPGSRDFH